MALKQNDLDGAATLFQQALDMQPEFAPTHYHWGRYWMAKGQNEKAFQSFQEATRLDPNCGLALYYTGEILRHVGKLDEAEVFLKRALKPMAPDRRPVDALRALNQERKVSS